MSTEPTRVAPIPHDDFIGTADLVYYWLLYSIYAVGGVVALMPSQTLPAAIALTLAFMLTRMKKREKHPVLASHYQWLYRSFWLGMGVYLSVITVVMLAVAAPAIDTDGFLDAMMNGQMTTTEQMNDYLLARQPQQNIYIFVALGGVFALWWAWRCGHGMLRLWQQQRISKPKSLI